MSKCDECICGDITDEPPLEQSTVSQHFKILKEAEMIEGTVEGTRICYCSNRRTGQEIKELFGKFIDKIQPESNCWNAQYLHARYVQFVPKRNRSFLSIIMCCIKLEFNRNAKIKYRERRSNARYKTSKLSGLDMLCIMDRDKKNSAN